VRRLRLAPSVRRVHVGFMGCHAALNALEVASALATAQPGAAVIVCCTELCSLHFQYGFDAEQAVANALFADGAAAAVVTVAPETRPSSGFALLGFASRLVEGAAGAMTWRILDHGFAMTLSPRVPALVARALRPWIDDWLAGSGLRVRDVPSWAIHAGGPRIVGAVARALELPAAAVAPSRAVLRACGNMSSATVLFILDRLRRAGAPRPCVALAFGPGLAVEAVLLGGG
jgi:predicted naringenin-chalcone synthase